MAEENKNLDVTYFDVLTELLETSKKEAIEKIKNTIIKSNPMLKNQRDKIEDSLKKTFEEIITKPAIFYNNLALDKINDRFWSEMDSLDFYNDEVLIENIENKQFQYSAEFYQGIFEKTNRVIRKISNPSIRKLLQDDVQRAKMAQKQVFYQVLKKSKDSEGFKNTIKNIVPKESLSLEDLITKVDSRDFLWPEKTFFNIMYNGKLVPNLKSPVTFLDLKYERNNNGSFEEKYFVEDLLEDFEKYLVKSKNCSPEKAKDFIETSIDIFLDHIPDHQKVRGKLLSINRMTKNKLESAILDYQQKKKEIENRKIAVPAENKELKQLEGYIITLQEISRRNYLVSEKIEQSYKAYLIMLNLNHEKFYNDGIMSDKLKDLFKENHHIFKEKGLFDLGYEIVEAGMLDDEKYDDPITMASDLIIKKLSTIEDKINNLNFESYKGSYKKI